MRDKIKDALELLSMDRHYFNDARKELDEVNLILVNLMSIVLLCRNDIQSMVKEIDLLTLKYEVKK